MKIIYIILLSCFLFIGCNDVPNRLSDEEIKSVETYINDVNKKYNIDEKLVDLSIYDAAGWVDIYYLCSNLQSNKNNSEKIIKYNNFFNNESNINKIIFEEPLKILKKFKYINGVFIKIRANNLIFTSKGLTRNNIKKHLGIDFDVNVLTDSIFNDENIKQKYFYNFINIEEDKILKESNNEGNSNDVIMLYIQYRRAKNMGMLPPSPIDLVDKYNHPTSFNMF